jgi:hypothetical protein
MQLHVSERRACLAHRSTQRKVPCGRVDEERLTAELWTCSAIRPLRLSQDRWAVAPGARGLELRL